MFKVISLYTIFIMNFLLTKQEDECGSNLVTNCCKYDYVKGKCTECESGFFPLNDGCIPLMMKTKDKKDVKEVVIALSIV